MTDDWSGLKSIFAVQRICEDKNKKSNKTNYYISSLDESPEKLMKISREHWKIESLHWMLDVVFSEDDSMFLSEEAQLSMNSFRKFAISVHKNYLQDQPKESSIKNNMRHYWIMISYLPSLKIYETALGNKRINLYF